MFKKSVFKSIGMLFAVMMLAGCGQASGATDSGNDTDSVTEEQSEKYRVDYCGDKDLYQNARNSYEAGEKVTLYFDVIDTDTDYTFYLNDEPLDVDYSDEKGYIIKFRMPEEDITLRVEMKNSMENVTVSLRDIFISETGCTDSDIVSFIQYDFDGDGTEEAFALVGDTTDGIAGEILVEGDLWFVSDLSCEELHENMGMGIRSEPHYMTLGDTDYIIFDDVFMSESYSYVYYVEDSEVQEFELSGLGAIWGDEREDDLFSITDSTYDARYDAEMGFMIGHTWKKYYFFYDSENGNICEYGGTWIDAATVEFWTGRDLINELIPEGDTIDSVFMRGNGMIVINYEHTDEDGSIDYYHYIYDTLRMSFINDLGMETEEEPLEGTCLIALIPEMASYPEVPGPDGQVWF